MEATSKMNGVTAEAKKKGFVDSVKLLTDAHGIEAMLEAMAMYCDREAAELADPKKGGERTEAKRRICIGWKKQAVELRNTQVVTLSDLAL